jgi:hypothetical protein
LTRQDASPGFAERTCHDQQMAVAAFMGVKAAVRQHAAYIVFLEQSDLNAFCLNGLRRDADIDNM